MAVDFSKFDEQIDMNQLGKDINESLKNGFEYKTVPDGVYTCDLEKLELGATKDGRPMMKAMFRIVGDEDGDECEYTRNCLFLNRVLYGTKNDANMIASALGWLKSLDPSEDVGDIIFKNYSQFAELIADIAEDVMDDVSYIVDYAADAFNSISISDIIYYDD